MQDILTDLKAGVLTISFNRTERSNSLTVEIYRRLTQLLIDAESDTEIRVVVICGTDQIFSAGNDLGEFVSASASGKNPPAFHFLNVLYAFPKPLIAGVCGAAIGIARPCCCAVISFLQATMRGSRMPFVNLGLCPEAASSMLLPRLAGYQRAAEVLLTGAPFDTDKALAIGLANKVLPASMVLPNVDTLARELALKPASTLVETKRLMKMGDSANVGCRLSDEFNAFLRLLKGGAAQETIAAFREKREPAFSKF